MVSAIMIRLMNDGLTSSTAHEATAHKSRNNNNGGKKMVEMKRVGPMRLTGELVSRIVGCVCDMQS